MSSIQSVKKAVFLEGDFAFKLNNPSPDLVLLSGLTGIQVKESILWMDSVILGGVPEPYATMLTVSGGARPVGINPFLELIAGQDQAVWSVNVRFMTDFESLASLSGQNLLDEMQLFVQSKQKQLNAFLAVHFRPSHDPANIGNLLDFEKVTSFFWLLALRPRLVPKEITCGPTCKFVKAIRRQCIEEGWSLAQLSKVLVNEHTNRHGKRICKKRSKAKVRSQDIARRRAENVVGGVVVTCEKCASAKTSLCKDNSIENNVQIEWDEQVIALQLSEENGALFVSIETENELFSRSLEKFDSLWRLWFPHFFGTDTRWLEALQGLAGRGNTCPTSVPFASVCNQTNYDANKWEALFSDEIESTSSQSEETQTDDSPPDSKPPARKKPKPSVEGE
jgi:hypothetical protein